MGSLSTVHRRALSNMMFSKVFLLCILKPGVISIPTFLKWHFHVKYHFSIGELPKIPLGLQWSKSLGHLKCWNILPKFWCCNLGDAQKNSDPLMRMSKEFVKRYCKIYFQDVALRGMDLPMCFPPNYFDAFIDVVHYEDTLLPLWPQWHISCKKKTRLP